MSSDQTESNSEAEAMPAVPAAGLESADANSGSTQHSTGTRRLRRLTRGPDESAIRSKVVARRSAKTSSERLKVKKAEDFVGVVLASDRYRVKSQLGKGSMAYVFLAADNRLETDVVVKVPKPEKFTTLDFAERFKKECQLLVRFSHPHVVGVLDVGEYDQLPYVVMQLLSGGSLSDRLKHESNNKGQMAPAALKSWVGGVAKALDFCGRKGMIHRDVKPANILFDADQNPFVADFGLSKVMYGDHTDLNSSETAAGAVLGTPNYIAPEIVLGKDYDSRADQYSLGISVYHTLLGRPPMQGSNATATMINQTTKHLQLLSDIRSDVPKELALAIRKSIEKKPDARFISSEEFSEAIVEALRPRTNSSSPTPTTSVDRPAVATKKKKQRPATGTSSQTSAKQSPSRKKSRTNRSSASGTAAVNPDVEWLDLASQGDAEVFLPPRKGQATGARSKKKSKGKTPKKSQSGNVVLAMTAGSVVLFGLLLSGLISFLSAETAVEPRRVDSSVNITARTAISTSPATRPTAMANKRLPHANVLKSGKINLWNFPGDDGAATGGNAAEGVQISFRRLTGNNANSPNIGYQISFNANNPASNWAQPYLKGADFAYAPEIKDATAISVKDVDRLLIDFDVELPENLSFGVFLESGPRIKDQWDKGSLLIKSGVVKASPNTGAMQHVSLSGANGDADAKQHFVDSINSSPKRSDFYLKFNVHGQGSDRVPTSSMKVRRVIVKLGPKR